MDRITFTLQPGRGPLEHWAGYTSPTPGLVVCRAPTQQAGQTVPGSTWWVVHQRSGGAVTWRFSTRRAALAVAGELGELTDWTLELGQIGQAGGIAQELKRICLRYDGIP